jgi:hypothetical protein
MDRTHIEIDLPARVAAFLAPSIDIWLDSRPVPGSLLTVPVMADQALSHPAVTVRTPEIVLRLVDLQGVSRPYFLIEAADRPSMREIDRLEDKLTPGPRLPIIDDAGPVPARVWGFDPLAYRPI